MQHTNKSIYKPGETAEFIIVVLDKEGHSVCDAAISMTVMNPDNESTAYSTADGTIVPGEECGLYAANYTTEVEGNHTVEVTAQTLEKFDQNASAVDGMNVSFETNFSVLREYEFEIIREAQSKIDPTKQERFDVKIDIASFIETGADFVTIKEFVPAAFEITTTDATTLLIEEDTRMITWTKKLVDGKTSVNYSYSVPHVWPYLYALGPLELEYTEETFVEARPWYVAVDPITVINVQSYPTVGGNWTVMFTTTGRANLTITAVDGTTWSATDEANDLKFLEVKCGEAVLDYEWVDGSVFIENYECNETGYEVSKVLTSGKHTLEFRFGADVKYAYNDAGGWANSSFDRCKNITISNAGSSTLTNFPAYINLTYDSDMQPNYYDLRFYSNGCNCGGSLLDYEIENYTASNAHIWVRIPSLPAAGTNISVYYKNNTAVGSGENRTDVWDANYVMVQHLEETSGTHNDSTSYGNNGTPSGVTQGYTGKIDGADQFTTINSRVTVGTSSWNVSSGTVELWGYPTATTYSTYFFGHTTIPAFDNRIQLYTDDTTGNLDLGLGDNHTRAINIQTLTPGTWYHIALTWNGANYIVYVDGINKAQGTYSNFTALNTEADIGNDGDSATRNEGWNGTIDEVRVSKTVRNADWINQSYQMVANQSTYVNFGPEVASGELTLASISGYVFDNNAVGLSGVSVTDNQSISSNTSIAGGYYNLGQNYPNGSYNISFTKAGFNTGYLEVTVSGANLTNQNKTLTPVLQNTTIEDLIKGKLYSSTINANVSNITVWLNTTGVMSVRAGIYYHSNSTLLAQTETKNLTATNGNVTFNFSDPLPTIVSGTDYVLVAWANSSVGVYSNQTRSPTGDGYSTGTWVVIPSTPTTRFDKVDEYPTANDSDVINCTTAGGGGGISQFTFSNFSVPTGSTVHNLTIVHRNKRVATGTTANEGATLNISGTNYYRGAHNPTTSFVTNYTVWSTNPKTGVAWTAEDINGVGANALTAFGVNSSDSNPNVTISQVYATVNYTTPDYQCLVYYLISGTSDIGHSNSSAYNTNFPSPITFTHSNESYYIDILNYTLIAPTNITCNGGSCDITVNASVVLQASGSTDADGDAITYYIEALLLNSTTAENTTDVSKAGAAAGNWPDSTFDRCKNITISNAGSSTLTNFPAYVNLTKDDDMLSNYQDLRFYNNGCKCGGTLLDYEIENYTASNAHIWVRIPSLPAAGTNISVYYKNNTAVGSGQNPTGVWDSNHISVWHLKENPAGTAPQMKDSTSNAYHGTSNASMTPSDQVAGKIDGSLDFDGIDDAINIPDSTNWTLSSGIDRTFEGWFNFNTLPSSTSDWDTIIGTPTTTGTYSFQFANSSGVRFNWWNGSTDQMSPVISITTGVWYHYVLVLDFGVTSGSSWYLNGQSQGTFTAANVSRDPTGLRIGGGVDANEQFTGKLDEVRVSNINRSASWINQSYRMVANQGTYVSFGSEESRSMEANTSYTTYENLDSNYSSVTNLTVKVEVDSYDPSASVKQSTTKPDLYLEIYNGSSWKGIGTFNLPSSYTGNTKNTTNANFSLTTTDSSILTAWQNSTNQDLRIKGIYMDYYNATTIDEINYTNVWITINGKQWAEIGNHSASSSFTWNTAGIAEQTCVDLRARAIDLAGNNTYSAYYTKGCCLNISHPGGYSATLQIRNQTALKNITAVNVSGISGFTKTDPYNDVDSGPQNTSAMTPVVTIYNPSSSTNYKIWVKVDAGTGWNNIIADEKFKVTADNTAPGDVSTWTSVKPWGTDKDSGVTVTYGQFKDLYLAYELKGSGSGNSTISVLGEVA